MSASAPTAPAGYVPRCRADRNAHEREGLRLREYLALRDRGVHPLAAWAAVAGPEEPTGTRWGDGPTWSEFAARVKLLRVLVKSRDRFPALRDRLEDELAALDLVRPRVGARVPVGRIALPKG